MNDREFYAERLRACAALVEQYDGVKDVITYRAGKHIVIHTETDEQAVEIGTALGGDLIHIVGVAQKQWLAVEGATFRGSRVSVSGPHRDRRPLDALPTVEEQVA